MEGHSGPGSFGAPPVLSLSTLTHVSQGLANFYPRQAFIGGFPAFAQTFAGASYSCNDSELVWLTAGESARPHTSVPRALRATFMWGPRFYFLTILVIEFCIQHLNGTLLNAAHGGFTSALPDDKGLICSLTNCADVAASPATAAPQRAGFGAAVHVVNAVLLTAVLSATDSCFYASSRMLLSLPCNGQVPRVLGWVNSRSVSVPALVRVRHPLVMPSNTA